MLDQQPDVHRLVLLGDAERRGRRAAAPSPPPRPSSTPHGKYARRQLQLLHRRRHLLAQDHAPTRCSANWASTRRTSSAEIASPNSTLCGQRERPTLSGVSRTTASASARPKPRRGAPLGALNHAEDVERRRRRRPLGVGASRRRRARRRARAPGDGGRRRRRARLSASERSEKNSRKGPPMSSATSQVFMSWIFADGDDELAAAEGAVGIFAKISAASGSLRFTKSNGPWTLRGPGGCGSAAGRRRRGRRARRGAAAGRASPAVATLICTVFGLPRELGFQREHSPASAAERRSSATSMMATPSTASARRRSGTSMRVGGGRHAEDDGREAARAAR